MRRFFTFLKDHLWPAAGLAAAVICWVYGVVTGAGEIAALVLSPMRWQLIGGGLFLVSVLSVLIQWHSVKSATPAIAPTAVPAPPAPVNHAATISSHNQSGGITAAQVNINRAPKPKFVLGQTSLRANEDGTYTITCPFDVVAPYPPGSLYLAAISPGIQSLMVSMRGRSGIIMAAEDGRCDGCCWTLLQQPLGAYRAQVVTSSKQLSLEGEFR